MPQGTNQSALNLTQIREAFPALRRQIAGRSVAYFDGPGGTQVPGAVIDAVSDYLAHHNANTHWAYPTSQETDQVIAEARQAVADLLGAGSDEVAFGANMTTLTFHVARALGRGWGAGDEVLVTDLDHHANIAPWQAVARERGVTLRHLPFHAESGELDLAVLGTLLGPRTRLVAIGAASNALGTINDVATIATAARAVGALVYVDAVHLVPHQLVDVAAFRADFLACSAYKFYGPHVGILYGRRDRLQALDLPKLEPAPEEAPERVETGTLNHEGIAGVRAAIDWMASLSAAAGTRRERLAGAYAEAHHREVSLFQELWDGLGSIRGLTRHGPPPGRPRTGTVSFTIDGMSSRRVAERLAESALFVSNGDFYATTVVERLGHTRTGLVRVGLSLYSTSEEVRRLLVALDQVSRTQ